MADLNFELSPGTIASYDRLLATAIDIFDEMPTEQAMAFVNLMTSDTREIVRVMHDHRGIADLVLILTSIGMETVREAFARKHEAKL